ASRIVCTDNAFEWRIAYKALFICGPVRLLLALHSLDFSLFVSDDDIHLEIRKKAVFIDQPIPTTSQTFIVQPSLNDDQTDHSFGRIHYKLDYDFASNKLTVNIIEGKDLPAMDRNGMSDPYVKLCILPEGKQKFETKVQRNNLNPQFNETFAFNIAFNELRYKTLQFIVFDFDRLSKDDRIGQLSLPLDSVDFGANIDEWRYLDPPDEGTD
uniref:C2 domain-containing protein n=1 Tax=Parascaris univalens TaxID=6257 RepID=A0A915CFX7_PARUN